MTGTEAAPSKRTGPVRRPRNLSADAAGSIHDDATAQDHGFRGGIVAANIHLDQLPPLLLERFGPSWFEAGSLSLYFRHATVDGEPVQAWLEDAGDDEARCGLLGPGEVEVCSGTASGGGDAGPTALERRDLRPADPSDLRILADLDPGQRLGTGEVTCDGAGQRRRLELGLVTEPLDWYLGPSPWGGPIASPHTIVDLLYLTPLLPLRERVGDAVGLFGAIQLRVFVGPVFLDQTYRVEGEVVAVSKTPRTEVLWMMANHRERLRPRRGVL
jgi:hypothetical protein